jgi:hypothetical protein
MPITLPIDVQLNALKLYSVTPFINCSRTTNRQLVIGNRK